MMYSFFVFLSVSIFAQAELVLYPDFTVSMLREGRSSALYEEMSKKNWENSEYSMKHMDLFRYLYAKNILLANKTLKNSGYRISPVVHQVWLGNGDIPIKYVGWTRSWMSWLGWEYKLWTDEDVRYFNLYNKEIFDAATNNAEKSDILRLEILWRYGGVYVDMDFECVNPRVFDELNRCFDLYMGFEPIEHGILEDYNMPKVCNALIAAAAGHPFIKQLIMNMKNNCIATQDLWTVEKTGPAYMTRELLFYEL